MAKKDQQQTPGMAKVVERNIDVLLERSRNEEANKKLEEKIADRITAFTGSMLFVYIHLLLFGIWIFWNVGWLGLKPFDPSFVVLAMFASVEAIFLSTFVLISQNRMNELSNKQAELDLHVSLLTEHEVTKLITIVSAMAKKMNIEESQEEIEELKNDIHPEKVMDTMEKIRQDKF